jgi:undecaprenyl-diphosphatase
VAPFLTARDRLWERRRPIAGGLMTSSLGLFCVLTVAVPTDLVTSVDRSVHHALSPARHSLPLTQASAVVSAMTSMLAIGGLALIAAATYLVRRAPPRRIIFLLAAPILSVAVAGILKVVVRRDRPMAGDGFAFPSGHATNTTTLLIVVLFLAVPATAAAATRRLALLVCAQLLVGFARLLSGEHWLTDVVAGFLLGTVLGIGLTLLEELTRRSQRLRARQRLASLSTRSGRHR